MGITGDEVQLQQAQHVIRMVEDRVAKHLLEGHFFSI